jgi:hypothetical protein
MGGSGAGGFEIDLGTAVVIAAIIVGIVAGAWVGFGIEPGRARARQISILCSYDQHVAFSVYVMPGSTRMRVLATVAERLCERRAGSSGARRGQTLPASKTGRLSIAVVARHSVIRPEAVGHASDAILPNGQAIQPHFRAPQPQDLRAMRFAAASL